MRSCRPPHYVCLPLIPRKGTNTRVVVSRWRLQSVPLEGCGEPTAGSHPHVVEAQAPGVPSQKLVGDVFATRLLQLPSFQLGDADVRLLLLLRGLLPPDLAQRLLVGAVQAQAGLDLLLHRGASYILTPLLDRRLRRRVELAVQKIWKLSHHATFLSLFAWRAARTALPSLCAALKRATKRSAFMMLLKRCTSYPLWRTTYSSTQSWQPLPSWS